MQNLKAGSSIAFEDTDEIFTVKARDDRYLICVRPYTIQERDSEIKKWSDRLNRHLEAEFNDNSRGFETFDDFFEDCLEITELQQEYRHQEGDCPEEISEDTFCYTIVDLKENIRGADNHYCKFYYDKQEECEEALRELSTKEDKYSYKLEISRRNRVDLKIKEDISK